MLRRLVLLLTLVMGLAVASAEGTLRVRTNMDILSMDPAHIRSTIDDVLAKNVFSGLVKYSPEGFGTVVPDLAQSWTISDDGLEYVFQLREDAVFHHGYGNVTASDVIFSLSRHQDPAVASFFAGDASVIESIEAVGDYEVVIRMSQPVAGFLTDFLAYRPGYIISEKAMQERGAAFGTSPVGSGPFAWADYVPKSHVSLRPFDGYFGDVGTLDEVRILLIEDDAIFAAALRAGDVDLGYVYQPLVQKDLLADSRLRSMTLAAPQVMYLTLNTARAPLDDVRVRQALAYATDKEALVDFVLDGLGSPRDTVLTPAVFGYLDQVHYNYDPERAKALLSEAGYPNGLSLSIIVRPHQLEAEQGTALQAMWKQVGVDLTIIGPMDSGPAGERRISGDYFVATLARMRLGPDQIMTPLFHSASIPASNEARYSNPKIDELIDEAKAEQDEARRADLYREIQRIAQIDQPVIPLYSPELVAVMRPIVNGFRIPNVEGYYFNEISLGQ